jgi:hypothetical protein
VHLGALGEPRKHAGLLLEGRDRHPGDLIDLPTPTDSLHQSFPLSERRSSTSAPGRPCRALHRRNRQNRRNLGVVRVLALTIDPGNRQRPSVQPSENQATVRDRQSKTIVTSMVPTVLTVQNCASNEKQKRQSL